MAGRSRKPTEAEAAGEAAEWLKLVATEPWKEARCVSAGSTSVSRQSYSYCKVLKPRNGCSKCQCIPYLK